MQPLLVISFASFNFMFNVIMSVYLYMELKISSDILD